MSNPDLCLVFDDDAPAASGEFPGGRGGRGGRGRLRGRGFEPRRGGRGRGGRGGGGGGDGDEGSNLRRFASADNINRARGGRPYDRRGSSAYQDDSGFQGGRGDGGRRGGGYRGGGDYRGGRGRGDFEDRGRGGGYRGGRGRGDREDRGGGRGRGDRGGFGGRRNDRPRRFYMDRYTSIEEPDDLALRLTCDIDILRSFVEGDSMSAKEASSLLKLLEKIMSSQVQKESVLNILNVICTSRFLDAHLMTVIIDMNQDLDVNNLFPKTSAENVKTLKRIHLLLTEICRRLPSHASKGSLILSFLNSQPRISNFLRQNDPALEDRLVQLKEECDNSMSMLHEVTQRSERGDRQKRGTNEDDEIPPDDFTQLSIFPEGHDMNWWEKPFLRANKAEGAYKDQWHYLDVQFRLLREDYIRPLREGIREYKKLREKGEPIKKNTDLRLYHGVQVIGLACKDSLEHRIQFDISNLKHVRWQSSKRLLYGSLVCLTVDDFENISFAVVTNRDIKDLEKGILQIRVESGLEDMLDTSAGDVFTMAETTAYFEAYRHVLEGLQEMSDDFPLARYIVHCEKAVKPPRYVYGSGMPARMDLRSLLHPSSLHPASSVSVINPNSWPPLSETALDASQYEAVKTALTKELAIIQGPPGTGKTYVGLKVAKVLLDNSHVWNPADKTFPILVVCYTNHALDQFLEGILEFLPRGIVRVGSRCKNPALEEFNLKEIRAKVRKEKKTSLSVRNSIRDCFKALCALRDQVEQVSSRLEASTKGIVAEKALEYCMLDLHYASLTSQSSFDASGKRQSVMMDWLTQGMTSWEQGDDKEAFQQMVKDVTSQILEGGDSPFFDMNSVTPEFVYKVPVRGRAQMYRSWQRKVMGDLQRQTESAVSQNKDPSGFLQWQEIAARAILPDSFLKPHVGGLLFDAIRLPILNKLQLPSQSQRGKQHSDYCIRAWLGIPSDPDINAIQNTLDQLTEEDEEGEEGEDEQLNIEEEADLMQRDRQLDIDDDDDLFDFTVKKTAYTVKDAMADLGVVDTSVKTKKGQADEGGWQIPAHQRKQQAKRIQHLLQTAKPMDDDEASRVTNVWSTRLKVQDRVRLYLYWLRKYQRQLKDSIRKQADVYSQESRRMRELRFGEDQDILREATVIGMTTTGAARYRKVLSSVACPIVMLEEAAEVLEAHVVTTLNKSCQHLILIGDHQQLRPSPTVYELCLHYKLDLSLFERLVDNKLHHSTLAVQHRMRPEVSRLVRHIYPHLEDHDTTKDRPHIRGVKQDIFLLHHEVAEQRHDETSSKSNTHEAELCVGLCRYLLQQGYDPEEITILAAYSGQVLALKTLFKKHGNFFKGVRVTAVDNFQGEENDIIILSLVRSNEQGSVGFLKTDNRVCVALSRARNGMYAIGNFKLLAEHSELWTKIIRTAKQNEQLGNALILRCERHRDRETRVVSGKDFDSVPEGGCKRPCDTRLPCGHVCDLPCHGYDQEHKLYKCRKKCERHVCDEGHPCTKKCFEECGKCAYKVEKTVPMCGHSAMIECYRDPHTWRCVSRCAGRLPCGHQCSGKCGECRVKNSHVTQCTEEVERIWPCGHMIKAPCHVTPGDLPCERSCDVTLDCGHACAGTCGQCLGGRVHMPCKKSCGKVLEGCGHKCALPCGSQCLPCIRKCGTACFHSQCTQPCGEPCKPCNESCKWKCPHRPCESKCHDPCDPCILKCLKKLSCEHICLGFCGEKCFCFMCEEKNFAPLAIGADASAEESLRVDRRTKLIKLPNCGHIFRADALDLYVQTKVQKLKPGEALTCPACRKMILESDCWRYHRLLRKRHASLQEAKEKLIKASYVAVDRLNKILKSMDQLTHDAETEKSFASKFARKKMTEKPLDVNRANALTSQIKFARITEMILKVLGKFPVLDRGSVIQTTVDKYSLKQKTQALQKLLLKSMAHLSQQRCRELTAECRRLAYMALLCTAKTTGDQKQIDSCLQSLEGGGEEPTTDIKGIFSFCQLNNTSWRILVYNEINLAILDAPTDKELWDIEQTAKPPTPQPRTAFHARAAGATIEARAESSSSEGSLKDRYGIPVMPELQESSTRSRSPNRSASSAYAAGVVRGRSPNRARSPNRTQFFRETLDDDLYVEVDEMDLLDRDRMGRYGYDDDYDL